MCLALDLAFQIVSLLNTGNSVSEVPYFLLHYLEGTRAAVDPPKPTISKWRQGIFSPLL